MAFSSLIIPATGVQTNPTDLYVPVNNGGVFVDSRIFDGDITEIEDLGWGFQLNYALLKAHLGRLDGGGRNTYLEIEDVGGTILVNGNTIESATVGAPAARFLKITMNGVPYKIQLFNP